MQIDIENPSQILSHVLLNDRALVERVLLTEEMKEHRILKVDVYINGVQVDAESFENTLKDLMKQVERRVREKYGADLTDAKIKEFADKMVAEFKQESLEKLHDIFMEWG